MFRYDDGAVRKLIGANKNVNNSIIVVDISVVLPAECNCYSVVY